MLRRGELARIAFHLRLVHSTVHRVLVRYGLAYLDRATALPVRRYERATPGELAHVDIEKLGNIPGGGGRTPRGRPPSRPTVPHPRGGKTLDAGGNSHVGYSYLHNAVDDHSRLAYTEILPDERRETAAAFWQRAQNFFDANGITVQRVLSDNGSCYRSRLWRDTLTDAGITHERTRPYRSQTNGKVERFNRTLLDAWA